MDINAFAPNLSFFFSNGMDPEYTVLGRVARRIWAIAMNKPMVPTKEAKSSSIIFKHRAALCTLEKSSSTISEQHSKHFSHSTTTATVSIPMPTTRPSQPQPKKVCEEPWPFRRSSIKNSACSKMKMRFKEASL